MKKILFTCFLAITVALSATADSQAARLRDFAGRWINQDADTGGITRINIRVNNGDATLRAWGSCSPRDCDWGRVTAQPYSTSVSDSPRQRTKALVASFRTTSGERWVITEKAGNSRIRAQVFTRFAAGSSRNNYTRTYTFRRASGSSPPAPAPAPAPAPPPPPSSSLEEDCVNFDWRRIELRRIHSDWKIVDGSHWIMSFGDNRAEALQALQAMRHYRMTQHCFVGRPNPSMTYCLTDGRPPSGSMHGEDCLSFDPDRLRVRRINHRWKIVQGSRYLMDFGDNRREARKALNIIQRHGFRKTCFIGRPDPSMTYMKR